MKENFHIYSKKNCSYCTLAKDLLKRKNATYTETVLDEDMSVHDFMVLFPEIKTMPFIILNGSKLGRQGGYRDLLEYYKNKPELLLEDDDEKNN